MSELVTEVSSGSALSGFSGLALEDIPSGSPVYVNRVNGRLGLAQATTEEKATFVGLAQGSILAGFVGQVDMEVHTEADWTAIAGTAALSPGQIYYVAITAGMIGTSRPSVSGEYVTSVGVAISALTLKINTHAPIRL